MKNKIFLVGLLLVAFVGLGAGQGLELEAHFNESSSPLVDFSGNNKDLTWNGDITGGVDGADTFNDDKAYSFDGSGDYLDRGGNGNDIHTGSSSFTVSIWIKNPGFGSSDQSALMFGDDADNEGFHIYYSDGNGFRPGFWGSPTYHAVNYTVDDGNWHHIAAVYNQSEGELTSYVDAKISGSNGDGGGVDIKSNAFHVGQWIGGGDNRYWDGDIDEFKFYNRPLTASEVQKLYNNNFLNDAPSCGSVNTTPSSWSLNSSVDVSAECSDSEGSVSSVSADVWENGSQIVSGQALSNTQGDTWEVQDLFTVNESEVYYNYTLTATDDQGATSTYSDSQYVDYTAPRISVNSPSGSYNRTKDLSLNFTVEDPKLDSSTCQYSKDGGALISLPNCENASIDYNSVGQHNVTVYASDSSGNEGNASSTFSLDLLNEIRAVDKDSSSGLSNFSVSIDGQEFSSSNNSYVFQTSSYVGQTVDIEVDKPGYISENKSYTFTDSTQINETFELEKSSITLQAFDEISESGIDANWTVGNDSKTVEVQRSGDLPGSGQVSGTSWSRILSVNVTDVEGVLDDTVKADVYEDDSSTVSGGPEQSVKAELVFSDGSRTNHSILSGDDVDNDYSETFSQGYDKELVEVNFYGREEDNNEDTVEVGNVRVVDSGYLDNDVVSADFQKWESRGLPTGDLEVSANSKDYSPRTYYGSLTSSNKLDIDTYLLEKAKSMPVSVEVYDSGRNSVSDALMTVQKNYNDGYRTVSQAETLSGGSNSFSLDPDTSYQILVSHPDYVAFQGTFSPLSYQYEPLEIVLGSSNDYNFTTGWDSISYRVEPETSSVTENASFNFEISDSSNSLEEFGLKLYDENLSLIKEESVTGSPSGGSLEMNASVTGNDNVTLEPYFYKDDELYELSRNYLVRPEFQAGENSLTEMVSSFKDQSAGLGQGMIALIFSLIAGLTVSTRLNRKGGGLVVLIVLGVFTVIGFINPVIFSLTLLAVAGVLMM